jgi:homoserine O-acetyltransferase/O-succinyltransferase
LRGGAGRRTLVATSYNGEETMKHLALAAALLLGLAGSASAADYPAPQEMDVVLKNFRFHTGETLSEVKIHVATLGDKSNPAILLLHGTGGNAATMLTPAFAGQLFGPGQPLDATKYFLIIPDALGTGKSTKPSDGLKGHFPRYDYTDMVNAQFRTLVEGLEIKHLRLVMGNSMGGMQTWMWGEAHPDFMDALVPMASQPTPMASRNWMLRRLLVESIRQDPAYKDGDYSAPPPSYRLANAMFSIATSGGTLAYQAMAPNSAKANAMVEERLAAALPLDANDYVYQWASSEDYDASADLERITAKALAINSADDERNPPETGVTEAAIKRVKNARLLLIPASAETRGHGTTAFAKFYAKELGAFLSGAP